MPVERKLRAAFIAPRFHFHKGKGAPAPGDNIHFAARDPRAPSENLPALETQVPAGKRFGAAAAPFGLAAAHFVRSSARA